MTTAPAPPTPNANQPNAGETISLRDHIAQHLQSHWTFATPILWENTPPPQLTPKHGWLRFRLRHGRTTARTINGDHHFRRGSVRFEIAVAAGAGMAELDKQVEALIVMFANKQIGNVRFHRFTTSLARHDNGYVLVVADVNFIHPLSIATE